MIITIDGEGGADRARFYLGNGTSGELLPDDRELAADRIAEEVELGINSGKTTVLVKAAAAVKHGDVEHVCAAAGRVEGISLHLAVFEVR